MKLVVRTVPTTGWRKPFSSYSACVLLLLLLLLLPPPPPHSANRFMRASRPTPISSNLSRSLPAPSSLVFFDAWGDGRGLAEAAGDDDDDGEEDTGDGALRFFCLTEMLM